MAAEGTNTHNHHGVRRTPYPAAFDHATARIGPTTTKIELTIDDEADDDLLRCQLQRKLIGPSVLLLIIAYKYS